MDKIHLTGYLDDTQSLNGVISNCEVLEGDLKPISGELIDISSAITKLQIKTVTPSSSQQIVSPDDGYNYLSHVIVDAIPYTETPNEMGGTTIRIG